MTKCLLSGLNDIAFQLLDVLVTFGGFFFVAMNVVELS
jgi:hypothetical protein